MNFKSLSLPAVIVLGIGSSLAAACGGSVDIGWAGAPDDDGDRDEAACGDGNVDADEACDDENTEAGDGCGTECTVESGYSCTREPSECARTVGDGDIDEGETCDDGNVTSGDGCSDTGQIEGTCEMPFVVALEPNADGVLVGRVESSTSGGGSQLDAADCGGDEVGAGPDRIFQIDLPAAADLTIRVESTFNPVLRLLNAPCDLAEGRACENDGGVGADESISVPSIPAGTYYVAVDGAQGSQQGDFTLRVSAACPADLIKLQRLNFYDYDLSLVNTSDSCSVNLDSLVLGSINESSTALSDLPDVLVGPGEEFHLGPYSNDFNQFVIEDDFAYPYYVSAGLLLCRGDCDFEDGSNVTDAFFAGTTAPPTPPSGLTFTPAPLASISNYWGWLHYERGAFEGAAPDFLATDWRPTILLNRNLALPNGPVSSQGNWSQSTAASTLSIEEDEDGNYMLRSTATAAEGETVHYFGLNGNMPNPRYVRIEFRAPGLAAEECLFDFWDNATATTWSFRFFVSNGVGYSYNTYSQQSLGAILPNEWHVLEYELDWTAATYTPTVDGEVGPVLGLWPGVPAIDGVAIGRRNIAAPVPATHCDVREIKMY